MTLDTGASRRTVVVPASALQEMNGRTVVFVEERPGRFRPREIQAAVEDGGVVEVRRGLAAGERVATKGAFLLKSALLNTSASEGD